MIAKSIQYLFQPAVLICDARCDKAWGISHRPYHQLSNVDEDDYETLADDELGAAPINPGTAEGSDMKPQAPEDRLNKWCARECERSVLLRPGETETLPDFTKRIPNIPTKRMEADDGDN